MLRVKSSIFCSSLVQNSRSQELNYSSNNVEMQEVPSDNGELIESVKGNSDSSRPVSIIKTVSSYDDAFEDVKKLPRDHLLITYNISESLKPFDHEKFTKFKEKLQNLQVISIRCELNGKFSIIWKNSKNETYAVNIIEGNNIEKEDLTRLCSFILEFINECVQNDHSGLSISSKNQPRENFNIDLQSLANCEGLNLLFHASLKGNSKIIPILLDVAFNVSMMHEGSLAVSFAYANHHFEAILELLKRNSAFPVGFNVENCPNEELKIFTEMHLKLHDHIKENNLDEIRNILSENSSLRIFYNFDFQSASGVAIMSKNFKVYELLLQNNLSLSNWEYIDDLCAELSEEEKEEITEIHFRNKKDLDNHHLNQLMSKCSVGHDDENVKERLNHVMRAFQVINKFPIIQIILKIAALLPNLQIVFDFNRDSVEYLDPTQNSSTLGLFYFNGRVYVGAKQLLNPLREHEVFATIAHELCHFVLYSIFGNKAKPYKLDDHATETEFKRILCECELKKNLDEIIKAVFDYYPERMFHAELIVRIPHFYAHYNNQPEKIKDLKVEFKSLFEFFELNLVPKLEESLKDLKVKAEEEIEKVKMLKEKFPKMETKIDILEAKRKEKNKKITKLIIGLIVLALASGLGIYWVFCPTYKWSELDYNQRLKVLNGNLRFERVEAKFKEIYGQNETTNAVFEKLTSDQIKILLSDDILDLNEVQNEFLQKEIFLIYQNLTEKFKEKVQNSLIDFQGQSIVISSLLGNKTEKILQTLNSTQILDLIKDKKSIKIYQATKSSTDFYIERKFIDNSQDWDEDNCEGPPIKLSYELFNESVTKKLILLSDASGNGKTTTFKHFALEWKQKFPLQWVQYVDLKSKIKIFQKYQNRENFLGDILSEIFDLKDLNYNIFKMLFNDQNVVILWDGFDEISPTYSNFMLEIIDFIENKTENIQFLSTRPHYEYSIKKYFDCVVYNLKPLTREDNEEFFKQYYIIKKLTTSEIKKFKEKVPKLIASVQENVEKLSNDCIESPLMLEMIAEVSLYDDETFDTTNLYTVYDSFIDAKLKLINDKGEIVQTETVKSLYEGLNLKETFQHFAIKLSINNYDTEFGIFYEYKNKKNDINLLSRFGILIFESDGTAEFVHYTFKEFFLAQYLVENLNSEKDCKKIIKIFNNIVRYTVNRDSSKVREFMSGYFAKYKSVKIGQNLVFCFKNYSELNNLFYKVLYKDGFNRYNPDIDRVVKFLEFFPFTSESLEILWHVDRNKSFFSEIALNEPKIFVDNFDKIEKNIIKFFPNDEKQLKKLLSGYNQRGSLLYVVYNNINKMFVKFDVNKYLNYLNVSFDFDLNILKKLKIFEFYEFVKSHLNHDEIREMFRSHFVNILAKGCVKIWNEIEIKFEREELQELIYESTSKERPLLWYVKNFSIIKLILKTLHGTSDSRFFKFIQYKDWRGQKRLLLRTQSLLMDDNFKFVWNLIVNRTTKDERNFILEFYLLDDQAIYDLIINIFSASIDFGTVEKFKLVKKIYEEHFNSTKMRELCENYFEIERNSEHHWHPKLETAEAFVENMKSLFTTDEIKIKFEESLSNFYTFYSERENLDFSYPLFKLLKELKTVEEFEKFRLSLEFIKESKNYNFERKDISSLFDDIPTEIDHNKLSKISTFFDFFQIIKPLMSHNEIQEYLETNFIEVITIGGLKMWKEIESKFSREELQEIIYESSLENGSLFYYVRDFTIVKLIFKILEGTPDSQFFDFIQDGNFYLLRKELLILDDDFESVWNEITNRTTKDERIDILKLHLLDEQQPYEIFMSCEFGIVETFKFVKNIYEQHFNLTEEMRELGKKYFQIVKYSYRLWHPKINTSEAFVDYLKSLFSIDEIKDKFKNLLEELHELYSENESLDYSYSFLSLLK